MLSVQCLSVLIDTWMLFVGIEIKCYTYLLVMTKCCFRSVIYCSSDFLPMTDDDLSHVTKLVQCQGGLSENSYSPWIKW